MTDPPLTSAALADELIGRAPVTMATVGPELIRTAAATFERTHAHACGHPAPWTGRPGDPVLHCPQCMIAGTVFARWDRDTQCDNCGAPAGDSDTWLVPFASQLLVYMKLCPACVTGGITPIELETEARR